MSSLSVSSLTPDAFEQLVTTALATIPEHPGQTPELRENLRRTLRIMLTELAPADMNQGMQAVLVIASRFAAWDCFRRATPASLANNLADRLRSRAIALGNAANRLTSVLKGRQPAVRAPQAPRPAVPPAATPRPTLPAKPAAAGVMKDPLQSENPLAAMLAAALQPTPDGRKALLSSTSMLALGAAGPLATR
ncbi:MAG: hypothetical protein JO227_08790 [Acetobacteraceae bacterium]|nr:hypothetical protein [Acetobacteraceae bacterium]